MPAHRPPSVPGGAALIPGVEGVRAVAAVSVLVVYCWWYGAEGAGRADLGLVNRFVLAHLPLGVTLVFSLLGFLLSQPVVAAALSGSPVPRAGRCVRDRALRILPAYWVILVAVALLCWRDPVLGWLVDAPGLALRTATLTQGDSPRGQLRGIAPAWSLAVEVVCYLTLPLLGLVAVVIARRAATPRWRLLAGRGRTLGGSGGFVVNLAVLGVPSGLLSALTCRSVERRALGGKPRRQPQPAAGVIALEPQTDPFRTADGVLALAAAHGRCLARSAR